MTKIEEIIALSVKCAKCKKNIEEYFVCQIVSLTQIHYAFYHVDCYYPNRLVEKVRYCGNCLDKLTDNQRKYCSNCEANRGAKNA